MTDLEITKLCAEAMRAVSEKFCDCPYCGGEKPSDDDCPIAKYDPLHNDGQAMALVKKFKLRIGYFDADYKGDKPWRVMDGNFRMAYMASDLNRAICECIAKTQANKCIAKTQANK